MGETKLSISPLILTAEPESCHPYFLQTYDVFTHGKTLFLSAKKRHCKIRLCAYAYILSDVYSRQTYGDLQIRLKYAR